MWCVPFVASFVVRYVWCDYHCMENLLRNGTERATRRERANRAHAHIDPWLCLSCNRHQYFIHVSNERHTVSRAPYMYMMNAVDFGGASASYDGIRRFKGAIFTRLSRYSIFLFLFLIQSWMLSFSCALCAGKWVGIILFSGLGVLRCSSFAFWYFSAGVMVLVCIRYMPHRIVELWRITLALRLCLFS